MELIGSCGDILHIICRLMARQNPRLVDHGIHVGYMAAKMMEDSGASEKDVSYAYILGVLHDIGAYKTDTINSLLDFEYKGSMSHSVYGSLLIQAGGGELMEKIAEGVLYHHIPWDKLKTIDSPNVRLSNLINLCDRVDIYHRGQKTPVTYTQLEQLNAYSQENIQLFKQCDEKFHIQSRLLDGSYILDSERFIYRIDFDKETLLKFVQLAAFFIDFRSPSTVTHTVTLAGVSVELGKLFGLYDMLGSIFTGAYFHDLGKVVIPLDILEKPGALTSDEMEIMRTHIIYTGKIIKGYVDDTIYHLAVRHHERADGTGYPLRLKNTELTLAEKILAVGDVFSALSGKRSYKEPFPKEKIVSILRNMADQGHLSKIVVDILINHYDEVVEKVEEYCAPIMERYMNIKEQYPLTLDRMSKTFP